MKAILLILLMLPGFENVFTQEPDAEFLISKVLTELEKIKSYQVDVEIEVDVEFINMPVKHATMYYKHPDKIKFKSDEFIMLPKKGLNNGIRNLLSEPYSIVHVGTEMINGSNHHVVKIIPLGRKPDIILATLWINAETYLVSKSENSTRNEGTFTVEFSYTDPAIALPSEMIISFEIENLKIPLKFIGKTQGIDIDADKAKGKQEGKVYLRFKNYILNQPIDNSVFEDENYRE
jgi:hypothetical protein